MYKTFKKIQHTKQYICNVNYTKQSLIYKSISNLPNKTRIHDAISNMPNKTRIHDAMSNMGWL